MNDYSDLIRFLFNKEVWMKRAACRGMDINIFFPQDGQSTKPGKKICGNCPVRFECEDYARRINTRSGMWGGKMRKRKDLSLDDVVLPEPVKVKDEPTNNQCDLDRSLRIVSEAV